MKPCCIARWLMFLCLAAGGGALWRPWYDSGRHGSLCFCYLQAWLLSFVLQMYWFLHEEGRSKTKMRKLSFFAACSLFLSIYVLSISSDMYLQAMSPDIVTTYSMILCFMIAKLFIYQFIYVPTYLHMYLHIYLHTYIPMYLRIYIPTTDLRDHKCNRPNE